VLSDEITLPCAQALLAGTLALMSAYAAPLADAGSAPDCRLQMARKVVENLFLLREHPGLAPSMRAVVAKLQVHWAALAEVAPGSPAGRPAGSTAKAVRRGPAARLH
jgi:hypothetical protein